MSGRVDRAVEEVDAAMTQLRHAMRGMPIASSKFKADHDRLRRSVGTLTVELTDAKGAVKGD